MKKVILLGLLVGLSVMSLAGCNGKSNPGTIYTPPFRGLILTMDPSEEDVISSDPDNNFKYIDDNTGSNPTFDYINFYTGPASIKVGIPTSDSGEAKIMSPVITGDRVLNWNKHKTAYINIYVPFGGNCDRCWFYIFQPNLSGQDSAFFGGPFGYINVKQQWAQVEFELPDSMKNLDSTKKYRLGISFFHSGSSPEEKRLNMPINVDGIGVKDPEGL